MTRFPVSLTMALLSGGLMAETYFLESAYSNRRNDGDGQTYTVVNTDAWATADGGHPEAFLPTDAYVVASARNLCLPAKAGTADSINWNVKSLRIGEVGVTQGIVSHYLNGSATMTYGNDGLVFARGDYCAQTYPGCADVRIDGKMLVTAPAAKPFQLSVAYANAGMSFCGDLSGDADTGLCIGAKPLVWDQGVVGKQTIRLRGDTSAYLGTVVVTSRYESASGTDWGMMLAGGSTLPGRTTVHRGCLVAPLSASDTLTFGTLDLRDGSGISIPVAATGTDAQGLPTGYCAGKIVVTESFAAGGKVLVRLPQALKMTVAADLAVLTVPYDPTLDKDDFTLAGWDRIDHAVVSDETKGTTQLVLKIPAYVYLVASDPTGNGFAGSLSATTNAAQWSDNALPHPDADYYVSKLDASTPTTVHTPGGGKPVHGTYAFGGASLTFDTGCQFYSFAEKYTIAKLTMLDGSGIKVGQWSYGNVFSGTEFCVPSGTVTLMAYSDYDIVIDMPMKGAALIKMAGVSGTSAPLGHYRFTGDNSAFLGRMLLTQTAISGYAPIKASGYQELSVSDISQLGGRLEAFDPQALTIERFGVLKTGNSFTFDASRNRGLYISEGTYGGRINTAKKGNGTLHELTFASQLTMNGILYKEGPGILNLGGTVKFGPEAEDSPTAGGNVLKVEAGTLAVSSVTGCDGLSMEFAAGTQLLLKPNLADAAFAVCGVKNVKTDTPFVLGTDVARLPFAVDWSGITPETLKAVGGKVRFALLTVSAAAAPSVRTMFSASDHVHRVRGFVCQTFETTDAAGNVVFGLDYVPSGLMLIVR